MIMLAVTVTNGFMPIDLYLPGFSWTNEKQRQTLRSDFLRTILHATIAKSQLRIRQASTCTGLMVSVDIVSITVLLCILDAIQNSTLKIQEANAQVVLHLRKQLVVLLQS